MSEMRELTGNRLPAPTWNWLKANEARIRLPEQVTSSAVVVQTSAGVAAGEETAPAAKGAIGSEYDAWLAAQDAPVHVYRIGAGEPQTINICMDAVCADSVFKASFIAEPGAEADVVLEMSACGSRDKSGGEVLAVQLLFAIGAGARVRLHQLQMMNKEDIFLSDIGSSQEEGSSFTVIRANLGARQSFLGLNAELLGKSASLESTLAYLADKGQQVDANDIAGHTGRKTESRLNIQGVLLGDAKKVYRGTIDLRRGAVKAKGQEAETVLLLSDEAVNQTVPLILCAEEDVEGNHGATIGRLDEETLFYMESHGMDRESARRLAANGRIEQVLRLMPEELAERGRAYLKEALKQDE